MECIISVEDLMRGVLVAISDDVLDQADQEYRVLEEKVFNQNIHLGCGRFQLTPFDNVANNVYFTWSDRDRICIKTLS